MSTIFETDATDGDVVITDACELLAYAHCLRELDEPLPEHVLCDLEDCGAPGDAGPSVTYFIEQYEVECPDPGRLVEALSEYGAWDDDELADHHENVRRAVWLAGSESRENAAMAERSTACC